MKKMIKEKIVGGLAVLGILFFPVLNVQAVSDGSASSSSGGFRDIEKVENNFMQATSLDAEVTSPTSAWQEEATAGDLLPGESVTRNFKISNVGGLNFQYKVAFEKTDGSDDLCSALQLRAEKGISEVYNGNLSDFEYAVTNLESGHFDKWHFTLTLPAGVSNLSSLDCKFNFVWTAWQTDFSDSSQGWVDTEKSANTIHTGITAPTQTGYNVNDENDPNSYSTPRDPNEIACTGGYTNINGVSIHWTDVAHSNPRIKYERQYKKVGAYDWRGSEIYTNPYTNYRTFGGNPGSEGTYGSRVRAWDDANGNNQVDPDETVSEWSNECSITYDITPPAQPTGLRRIAPNENNKIYACGALSKIQRMWPDWDDNTETDFDHYEYTSFNAPHGAIGLHQKIFYDSIFQYNGSWMPQDGTYGFAVRAVDKAGNKSEWAIGGTETLADSCQITYDSTAPRVEITNPDDEQLVSGEVDIRGTVTDAHPDHYWLVVQDESGHRVAGPGTVYDTHSFTNKKLYTWDTTAVADGEYTIKLEARDQLGNKDPDEAPVASDPENPNDSVDWITVRVDNTAPEISDEYFEVSTKGEENPDPADPTIDAIITWKTNEPATSVVEWGTTSSYGHIAELPEDTTADKTKHKVVIEGLPLDKETYHFRIKSEDGAGNVSYGSDQTIKIKGIIHDASCHNPHCIGSPVVINEFLPNPDGDDNAHQPKGEWIELYNKSDHEVSLGGWFLADRGWHSSGIFRFHHRLSIPFSKIGPHKHLVVYNNTNCRRNSFCLNNNGDKIMLIQKVVIRYCYGHGRHRHCRMITKYYTRDSYSYTGAQVAEGKSIARFPDGGNVWIDPKTTPGKDNQLNDEELKHFREYTLDKCFKKNKLKKHPKDEMCDRQFLVFLGMIKNEKSDKLIYKEKEKEKKRKSETKQKAKSNQKKENKEESNSVKSVIPPVNKETSSVVGLKDDIKTDGDK